MIEEPEFRKRRREARDLAAEAERDGFFAPAAMLYREACMPWAQERCERRMVTA